MIGKYFRAILDNTPESIVLIGKNHQVLAFNKTMRDVLLQYHNREIKEGDLYYPDFVIEPNRQLYLEAHESAINGVPFYVQNLTKNENVSYWFEYKVNPVYDEAELLGVTLSAKNITSEKEAELTLRQSEEKYRRENLLLEESQSIARLGGWELDLITEKLYWTAETYRIHDTSAEEFDPTVDAWMGYFSPDSKKIISKALDEAMTKGKGYDLHLETYTTKGRLISARTTCVVTMAEGKPTKLSGTFQDITEQRKTQHELEISNARLNLASSSANIGIWEYGIDDKSLIWNEQMFALYGITENSFSSNYEEWSKRLHPEDRARSEQELQNAIAGGKGFNTEFRVVWPDKSIHHIRAFANVIRNDAGKAIKMIGANYDITENIHRQIELAQAKEKAEENDRLKSAFMANMRHEIRNPMNAIIGFSKQMAAPEITDAKRTEYSSIVINSSHQLLSIIDDITSISLLETKQEHVNKSDVNINHLLSELEIQFAQRAKTRDLKLILKKSLLDEESVIATDKSKLTRIITNLLTNALKFTHKGSVEFGYHIKDTDLVFYVKDSGIGIAPSQQTKIFESFQQADGNINRKYGGTGLGLSICKGLTELLGGKIWLESEIEKGSTFYLSMLFNTRSIVINPSRTSPQVEMPTILIAEDEFINFYYLKIILEQNFNCKILHAANGEEAVALFKNNPEIVFVLMDISMPIMDGFDAARLIKEMNPDIPIIAQTGYDIQSNKKYDSHIINDHISKPIDEVTLITKVTGHVRQLLA
jgi:PAS domain S-box-containing protein